MRYELNVTTGELVNRQPTTEELAQEALYHAEVDAENAERLAAEEATAAAKVSARAKLAALGLTDEEISAIVGG